MKQQKFELSHDIIAEKVWRRLPEVDKQLKEINKSLVQRHHDYIQEKGSFLGGKELAAWEDYFPRLDLSPELILYVEQSRAAVREAAEKEAKRLEREKELIQKNKQRQLRFWWVIGIAGALSAILFFLAISQYKTAEKIRLDLEEKRALTEELKKLPNELKEFLISNSTAFVFFDSSKNLPSSFDLPSAFIDSRDFRVYETVEIGGTTWMAENLHYNIDSEGSWLYNNDLENGKRYGRLYNWESAQKACPQGWRLPSDKEWQELTNTFGGFQAWETGKGFGEANFQALIEGGNSGFDAKPGGWRSTDGKFYDIDKKGNYWSSTEKNDLKYASYFHLSKENSKPYRSSLKTVGFSCRCVKVD